MVKSTVFKKNYIFNVIHPQLKLKLIMKKKKVKEKNSTEKVVYFKKPTISTNEIVNVLKLIDKFEKKYANNSKMLYKEVEIQ